MFCRARLEFRTAPNCRLLVYLLQQSSNPARSEQQSARPGRPIKGAFTLHNRDPPHPRPRCPSLFVLWPLCPLLFFLLPGVTNATSAVGASVLVWRKCVICHHLHSHSTPKSQAFISRTHTGFQYPRRQAWAEGAVLNGNIGCCCAF